MLNGDWRDLWHLPLDLSDGRWKQVVVEMLENGYTKIIVEQDSQSKIVPYRRSKLFEYHFNPFGPEGKTRQSYFFNFYMLSI